MSRATAGLFWDAVHVMARLLKAADALVGGLVWRNHRRAAKKRAVVAYNLALLELASGIWAVG
jgi:hypothetical protein